MDENITALPWSRNIFLALKDVIAVELERGQCREAVEKINFQGWGMTALFDTRHNCRI